MSYYSVYSAPEWTKHFDREIKKCPSFKTVLKDVL